MPKGTADRAPSSPPRLHGEAAVFRPVAGNTVEHLTWDEVERRLAAGAAAILPIGAGAKQHSWHLPMCTDQAQADWLAARLAEKVDALVWPTLTYGYYPAFVSYAGSASLSADVFQSVVGELVAGLLAYGPASVIVVNTGISTIAPIQRALDAFGPRRVIHLKVYDGPRYRAAAGRLARQVHGGHADELETSKMLALAPQSVTMMRAAASPATPPGPGPMQHVDTGRANYSASGSIGDPTLATAETGRVLLQCIVEDMCETVAAVA